MSPDDARLLDILLAGRRALAFTRGMTFEEYSGDESTQSAVNCQLLIIGEAILFKSSLILIYAALVFLAFHLFVTLYEEPTLKNKFGSSYKRYCGSVPRWIPRIK